MVVMWDEHNSGRLHSERLVCPGSHDFLEGRVHFLQFSGLGDVKLQVMLDLRSAVGKPLPIELSVAEVKQAASKHALSKVFVRSKETGAVQVLSEWDDLRDGVVAEAERTGEVVAIMHVAPWWW